MIERVRFRCPCCGMVTDIERLDRTHRIKVFIQRFGGKVPGENKGQGRARGYMEYKDITRSRPDIIEKIKKKVDSL